MAAWESESDERLLLCAGKDQDAFTAFYRRYEKPVLAYFYRRTGDPELAADLAAEVFAAVLNSSGRFTPGGAPAGAWLFGIAEHKLAHSRRRGRVEDRARRRLGMEPLVLGEDDLERIGRLGGEDAAVGLLDGLPPDQRDAVRARVLEERSYEQIAKELKCSQSVARKRVSRGLGRLREELGDQIP
jgi:RNA polymerase sigma-70 factor (ECF subfamily)